MCNVWRREKQTYALEIMIQSDVKGIQNILFIYEHVLPLKIFW
jgi:hypothetical protein